MRLFYQKSIYLSIYLSMYTDKIRLLGFTTLSKIRYDCWVILSYLISVSILDLLSIRGLFFLSLSPPPLDKGRGEDARTNCWFRPKCPAHPQPMRARWWRR